MNRDLEIPSQTRTGRPESPAVEEAAARAIAGALRHLVERCHLYQKTAVDLSELREHVDSSLEFYRKQLPSNKTKELRELELTTEKIDALKAEIERRPWIPITRHLGDDAMTGQVMRDAISGSQPTGTPPEKRNLLFYAPDTELKCSHPDCKRVRHFIAHVSTRQFASPYPREAKTGTEQVFPIVYRCQGCAQTLHTVLIRRLALKLHLCGFAPRREPLPSRVVPELLTPILADAEQAIAENDRFAAFYHLRTLLEHFLKGRLGKPVDDKITGDDLLAEHYSSLPKAWRDVLPPISVAYAALSGNIHARKGEATDFSKLRDLVCDHIDMLAMFEKQPRPTSPM